MAFKIGNSGLTSVDHQGKLNNMHQWPGDPNKLGELTTENVTFNFNTDSSTNYRMTYFPKTGTFYENMQGVLASRYIGEDASLRDADDPYSDAILFPLDSGDAISVLGDSQYSAVQLFNIPIGKTISGLASNSTTFAVGTKQSYTLSNGGNTETGDSGVIYLFDNSFKLTKTLKAPDAVKNPSFGILDATFPNQNSISMSGNRLAIVDPDFYRNTLRPSDPSYVATPNQSGRVYVYNMSTGNYEFEAGPEEVKPYLTSNVPILWDAADSDQQMGRWGCSIDGNLLAVASTYCLLVFDLDSSNPYKPRFHKSATNIGYGKGGLDVKNGYIAVGDYLNSSNRGKVYVFDSVGTEVFTYDNSSGNTTDKFGYNLLLAPDNSNGNPSGNLFVMQQGSSSFNHNAVPEQNIVRKFSWSGSTFSNQGTIRPTTGTGVSRGFGLGMAADPDRDLLIISATIDSDHARDSSSNKRYGAIYSYNYTGGSLTNEHKFFDSSSYFSKPKGIVGPSTAGFEFGHIVDISPPLSGDHLEYQRDVNKMRLKRPIGLKDNIGQSGSILIQKKIDTSFGVDSEGYFFADSCWWFPGAADVDSARVMGGLTSAMGGSLKTKDMINYFVFDSDKIFCSWQRDLR